jgi:ABC-2 type transport system ATP-binding protein
VCEGLAKRYGDVVAVADVGFSVHPGECVGLLGPNGAGKTTTVEMLCGLLPPDAGRIELLGREWRGPAVAELRGRIGVQLQEARLPDKLTVRETLRLFCSFVPRHRGVAELLAMTALEEKRNARVETLSGGQRQRLSLGCALAGRPEILFLDEPSSGLDPQSRRRIWEIARELQAEGTTVLLTTHYMEEAEQLCDRVAIIDHGRVIALDTPEGLVGSLGGEQMVLLELDRDADAGPLRSLPGLADLQQDGVRLRVTVQRVEASLPGLLDEITRQGSRIESLSLRRATLEDVFIQLTRRTLRDV